MEEVSLVFSPGIIAVLAIVVLILALRHPWVGRADDKDSDDGDAKSSKKDDEVRPR